MTEAIDRIQRLPIWSGPVSPLPLEGGLSNESFTVEDRGQRFVVRLGVDLPQHHVSREREQIAARAAHAIGLSPAVVFAEPGLMVSAFVEGRTYAAGDVRANIQRITALIKTYHQQMPRHVSGPPALFWPFHVVRDYARMLEAGNSRHRHQLGWCVELGNRLEAQQVPLPIVFGHNDLLPANIIGDGERLWLIDHEYAAFSTASFDLAGLASNAQFTPDDDRELLAVYFGRMPEPELLISHSAMKCASLLREAMWSMVSELQPPAAGVDYAAYTNENLARLEVALDEHRLLLR